MPQPRSHQQWAPKPSPLAKVHLSRPISQDPAMGLVRDPQFWKRFSTAIHLTEAQQKQMDLEKEIGGRSARSGTTSTFDIKDGDDWLAKQHKKKRRCRVLCVGITLGVVIVIIAAVVAGLYFTRRSK